MPSLISDRIVVLTKKSQEILTNTITAPKTQIIPRKPNVLWEHKEKLKETYHYSDRIVLSTFGLISENKILKRHYSLYQKS
jgi:hypothetical protein